MTRRCEESRTASANEVGSVYGNRRKKARTGLVVRVEGMMEMQEVGGSVEVESRWTRWRGGRRGTRVHILGRLGGREEATSMFYSTYI